MATWPVSLKVNRDGYKESPANNAVRSDMDMGPAKVRRRTTANIRPVSFTLFLTDDLLDTLETFYVTTLYSGSISFDFTSPRTDSTVEARFTQPPEYSREQTMWRVSVELEILP